MTSSGALRQPTCRCGLRWPPNTAGRVLDVGAGTGRVAARSSAGGDGWSRSTGTVSCWASLNAGRRTCGSRPCARTPASSSSQVAPFPLIAVPMQTLQLLGGAGGHLAFMRRARAHLRDGGILAVAIAEPATLRSSVARRRALPPDVTEQDGSGLFQSADRRQAQGRHVRTRAPARSRRRAWRAQHERRSDRLDASAFKVGGGPASRPPPPRASDPANRASTLAARW